MDLLVTHHPLFFKPVKRILGDTPQGRMIEKAITHKMAIYCAHTNLDSVSGGVNDALAEAFGT
jgi:putative NIF3 family GTP cyclohydrolase 1 type 2